MAKKTMTRTLAALLACLMTFTSVPADAMAMETVQTEAAAAAEAQSELSVAFDQEYAQTEEALTVTVTGATDVSYVWTVDGTQVSTAASYVPTEADLESFIEVTVTSGTSSASAEMYFSKLPVVYINTHDGADITSKTDYKDADLKIQGNAEYNTETTTMYDGLTEIRGRGNSTWGMPKKPYKLKLDKKTDLLGMGKNKHWVLLANYSDESLMRNTLSYDFSGALGMEHMSTVHVTVILNGRYDGNYQLCEQVRVDSTRVDVFDWESFAEDSAAVIAEAEGMNDDLAGDLETYMLEENMGWITSGSVVFNGQTYKISDYPDIEVPSINGGYVLELDEYYDEVSKFRTDANQPIMFKNPEFVYTNQDMMDFVQDYVQGFEDAVKSGDYTSVYEGNETHYSELYDFDALVDYWLITEIFFNEEINKKSTYMYKEIDELMKMGPIWDMDYSSGGEGQTYHTEQWATEYFNTNAQADQWYKDLIKDPYFLMRAQERYWEIRYVEVEDMLTQLEESYDYLKESAAANRTRWGYGQDHKSYSDALENWFNSHLTWMDEQMATETSLKDSLNYTAADGLTLALTDSEGNELSADIALRAAADKKAVEGTDLILSVTGSARVSGNAEVFVNSRKVGSITVGTTAKTVELPAALLTAEVDEKDIIEVKLFDNSGNTTAANVITVKSKSSDSQSGSKGALEALLVEALEKTASGYSGDSWAVFEAARYEAVNVFYDETADQNAINAAITVLQNAMDNLVEVRDPSDASDDYPTEQITYSAGSSQSGEGIELAFDGDENSLWHTQYSPHADWYGTTEAINHFWVLFELEEPTGIEAVRYLSRGANGDIASYRIEGSLDGTDWETLTEGTWVTGVKEWKSAEFTPTYVKYIRLVPTETVSSSGNNRHASAYELRLRTGEVEEVPPVVNPQPPVVDPSQITAFDSAVLAENAKANSEQLPAAWADDGGAAWAFTENDSWWHSRYQDWDQKGDHEVGSQAGDGKPSETNPIWIQTGFDQKWMVDHITYVSRGNGMGIIKDYTVSVANLEDPTAEPTDEDFTVVKTGTLENTTDEQTIQLDEAVEATHVRITVTSVNCTGDGHVNAKYIGIYGYDASEVEACEHTSTRVENTVDATCTEAGYTGDTVCSSCGLTIAEGTAVEALGHSWGAWTVVTAATTETEGLEERVCSACGETEERVIEKRPEAVERAEIPVSAMTVTAGDAQSGEEADKAIDDNESTVWHTNWYEGSSHDNHWFQITLDSDYYVNGFRYLPRQNGANGIITKYEIQVSADGETWETVASGEWAKDAELKDVAFDTVQTRYVRLVTVEAASDQDIKFASAAEIRLTGVKVGGGGEVDPPAEEISVSFEQEYAKAGEALNVAVTGADNVTYKWYVGDSQVSTEASYTPTTEDLENFIRVEVTAGTKTAEAQMYFSKLPVVYINTHDGADITSKTDYKDADLTIQGNDEYNVETTTLYDGLTEIRGRGNSTWGMPKKPYKLKLDKKTDLLGMGKNKHWVLLANYSDESLLRNTLSYNLSGSLGMEHMSTVFVSVVLNGRYDGNYQLCEQVRVDSTRVDVFDWESFAEDSAAIIAEAEGMNDDLAGDLETYMLEENMGWITSGSVSFNGQTYTISDYPDIEVPSINGGYVLELDEYYDEVSKFRTESNQPIMFKNPEFVATNPEMMEFVQNYVQGFEDAVRSEDYTAVYEGEETHYSELYDFDSLVDYWLVTEIFFNEEINKKSTYMYKEIDELMKMGPIWDMDWSSGGEGDTGHTDKWATLHFNQNAQAEQWYKYLIQDPYFLMSVQERYWEIRDEQVADMMTELDESYELLKESADANGRRWGYGQSYESYVDHLRTWFENHLSWMDTQMATEDILTRSLQYSVSDSLQLELADEKGNPLEADETEVAPADAEVFTGDCVTLFVTGTDEMDNNAEVYVNGRKVGALVVNGNRTALSIDGQDLTAGVGEKNVIEVKVYNDADEVVAANFITVRETADGCAHETTKVINTAEATCTEAGYTGDTVCEVCETLILAGQEIGALGHQMGEWVVVKEATVDEDGLEERTCGRCDHKEERTIDKLLPDVPDPIVNPFEDVTEADYFYDAVLWAVEEKITTGRTETIFAPYAQCSRADVVTFLYRAMGGTPSDAECVFTDVNPEEYYYEAMMWAVENGITKGMTETTFSPYATCTRADFVTLFWRALGEEKVEAEETFEDVTEADYFYDAVLWAVENEVTTGLNETTFGSYNACYRGDTVTFIYRALGK